MRLAYDLATRFRVIAVDLRGHGYSDAPATGYDDPKNWADDVAAVLAGEGIESGAILLGWSYGGIVLSDYLTAYGTGAVAGVVYSGSMANIGRGVPGADTGSAMRAAIPGVFEESAGRAVRAFGAFGNANTGPGADKGAEAQRLFGASLAHPARGAQGAVLLAPSTTRKRFARSMFRCWCLHGAQDPVVPIENGRLYRRDGSGCPHVVLGRRAARAFHRGSAPASSPRLTRSSRACEHVVRFSGKTVFTAM